MISSISNVRVTSLVVKSFNCVETLCNGDIVLFSSLIKGNNFNRPFLLNCCCSLKFVSDEHKALPRATVRLLRPDSTLVQTQLTDDAGTVYFKELLQGNYSCQVHFTGFKLLQAHGIDLVGNNLVFDTLVMAREVAVLSDVSVTSKKPFVQYFPDKTVINVESSITNTGFG